MMTCRQEVRLSRQEVRPRSASNSSLDLRSVLKRWNVDRTYGDLVGVLVSDLLDLFAAISCGEPDENGEFRLERQEPPNPE